ncbi:PREDICTED: uncharacterized protein C14orf105 homolog isoform X2 [Propithecus coquereli]|uniref:uncharacterized protein C14orf105 homolog isoform X2 n=1 Tax=Propithecus coquereli TaxID=379532 RepID=UPI00063F7EC7|nr:PREDICTED: uncharacterized protein C14orf105 homolog isoform X2 [Propithecus coquereli]
MSHSIRICKKRVHIRWQGCRTRIKPWKGSYHLYEKPTSRAMYFDIPLEQGETSIIKRHPPQRLQKLEPIDLPQVITSERLLSQRGAGTMHKAKEPEKKMQTPMYTSGKRQYLHKMQMLEMNRKRQEAQMELKKSLHREARINKPNPRDHKAKKILQSIPRSNDHDLLTTLPDETLNGSPGQTHSCQCTVLFTHRDRSAVSQIPTSAGLTTKRAAEKLAGLWRS